MPKQTINDIPGAVQPLFVSDILGAAPLHPVYSQVVISHRNVYVSGSIGCDTERNIVGGVHQQSRAALENMRILLEGAGSSLEHVVKVTVYLSNMARDFEAFNEIYVDFFRDVKALPARTCVGVAALPMGAFVEVECIAELAPRDE